MKEDRSIYGLMAQFSGEKEIVAATKAARDQGYRKMDAYSPYPVEALPGALGRRGTVIPLIVLAGGISGAVGGYLLQWWAAVDYPLNIGGRPMNSWPAYVPVTFEMTVLAAAFAAIAGMLALNRLPEPYHPVFNVPEFERSSTDKFFLCIMADDPKFDLAATRQFLEHLGPERISEVPR